MNQGFTYIMSNINHTVLYIGVTNNIERRVFEHKTAIGSKFATRYNCVELVHLEHFASIADAIAREKQLKNWKSDWKWELIKKDNPKLKDLAADWFTPGEVIKSRGDN